MNSFLSVRNIQASYGHAQALFDIAFEVGEGEAITLLGRNGMGRSTTVKCLFGILPVDGPGGVWIGDQRVDKLPSYQIARKGLALVPEGRQIFPNLTVVENLIATAREQERAGKSKWNLQQIYQFFPRLKERAKNLGSQLSGGEQQMLAIGRALMTNPRLLVLDEATEGLAPVIRSEIWSALADLKRNGLGLIIIDKNIKPLLGLADRHIVIEKGRVVWQGSSAELRGNPGVVQQYLGV